MMPRPLRRTLAAVAEAVLSVDGVGSADAVVGRLWDEMQPDGRRALALMLVALDATAVVRTGRRWHRLPLSRRVALCDALEHRGGTVSRSAFLGVKTLALVALAADPVMEARLGTAGWPPQLLRP